MINILCFGDFTGEIDLTVTGGTPATTGYTYDWNNGSFSDEDLTDVPFGTYGVLVTDSLLCSDSLTVTLTQPQAPIDIEFDILNVSCFGDSTGTVSASIFAMKQGIQMIRVHDVNEINQSLKVFKELIK